MVIRMADEAEELARQYLKSKYSVQGDIIVTRVAFDGNFFAVSGHWEERDSRSDFQVTVDKDGNIVGWHVAP